MVPLVYHPAAESPSIRWADCTLIVPSVSTGETAAAAAQEQFLIRRTGGALVYNACSPLCIAAYVRCSPHFPLFLFNCLLLK